MKKKPSCMNCDNHKYNPVLADFCAITKDHIEEPYPDPPCKCYVEDKQWGTYDNDEILATD